MNHSSYTNPHTQKTTAIKNTCPRFFKLHLYNVLQKMKLTVLKENSKLHHPIT